jgi:hypothetical protein
LIRWFRLRHGPGLPRRLKGNIGTCDRTLAFFAMDFDLIFLETAWMAKALVRD